MAQSRQDRDGTEPARGADEGGSETANRAHNAVLAEDTSSLYRFGINKVILWVVTAVAVIFSVFHIHTGYAGVLPDIQQRGIHLALVLVLVFLVAPGSKRQIDRERLPWYDMVLAAASLVVGLYPAWYYQDISARMGFPTQFEIYLGIAAICLILEATRRMIGWTMVVIVAVFLAYMWAGAYMPMDYGGYAGVSFRRAVSTLYLSQNGIFGPTLGASATYVALFIIFGAVVKGTGAGQFIIDSAHAMLGTVRGGPAKIAMIASGAMGTISGSATANAASTGAFTIPLMKRLGYTPRFAGAVEAVSSTGGQLMPPVMGSAAFIMAEFLQMPYREIAAAALIPALLYYVMLFVVIDLEAKRLGLRGLPRDALPKLGLVLRHSGHLLAGPIVLIYYLAIFKTTALHAAFAGTVAAILVGWLREHSRLYLPGIIRVLREGALTCLQVAVACAAAGLIIGPVFLTSLGPRLADVLINIASEQLFILLILSMIASIVMSMGLPSTAVYILVAVLIAPAMISLGVLPLAAHLFAYWFGTMANITPPVATAVYAASAIARSDPMKTGLKAVQLGLAGFILPFMFVYGPRMLLQGTWFEIAISVVTGAVGVTALAIAIQGLLFQRLTWLERGLFVAAAGLTIHAQLLTDIAGAVLLLTVIGLHYLRSRQMPDYVPVGYDAEAQQHGSNQ